MTPSEAVALAVIGHSHRRLLAALLRVIGGRATAEDLEALPAREPGESVIAWACRSRASSADPAEWLNECRRVQALAAQQLSTAARRGLVALTLADASYPPLLAAIPDPPPVLWVNGRVDSPQRLAIAVVGSRAATPHGIAMASRLSGDLARAGVVIVSGLARGVDSAAHRAALDSRGQTIGVLGCGLDRVYPSEHKELAAAMAGSGAVVSEFPVGVPPLPHHFPLRNRIISGLARAIVVVEAGEKSGALITAGAALEQGREVLVVPGASIGGRNRGGHQLIRDGARLVESADDILGELGGAAAPVAAEDDPSIEHLPETVAFTVDEVAAANGEPPSLVLARLLDLELEGRIQRIEGGRFVRASGRPPLGPRVTV